MSRPQQAAGPEAPVAPAQPSAAPAAAPAEAPGNGPAAPARGPLARLRSRRRSQAQTVCATCARELAGSASEARASGWTVNRKGRAICDTCQLQGWHLPDGATVPVRSSEGNQTAGHARF
jgi:hypothetical protein